MGKLIEKLEMSNFCKLLFKASNVTENEVAEKIGKTRQTINRSVNRNGMQLSTFIGILNACGEKFVIQLKNGESFEIEFKNKDNE